MIRAGFLGSSALPASVKAIQDNTPGGATFTVIGNAGAIALAKENA